MSLSKTCSWFHLYNIFVFRLSIFAFLVKSKGFYTTVTLWVLFLMLQVIWWFRLSIVQSVLAMHCWIIFR